MWGHWCLAASEVDVIPASCCVSMAPFASEKNMFVYEPSAPDVAYKHLDVGRGRRKHRP